MIVAVTAGRSYTCTRADVDVLFQICKYLGDVEEIWHTGLKVESRVGTTDKIDIALSICKTPRVFLPDPQIFAMNPLGALIQRNRDMMMVLDQEFQKGTRVSVVALPGSQITDSLLGQARRYRLPIIDLRARPYTQEGA
jgi:hypothetical protein